MKKFKRILFIVFFCGALFSVASFVSAESTVEAGLDRVDENIVLSDTNPREAAIRIINLALTFLGILAVGIVLYGGFVWMKSNGNETEIDKAKKILKSGLIGLVIILSAWGIVYFVITKLVGTGEGGNVDSDDPGTTCVAGLPCFCNGRTVCNNGVSTCANYDCTHSTTTPISCNGSLDLGVCQPNDNLCGSEDKFCNANCLCENKSQDGDSCGLNSDGSCDVNGNSCAAGLTCNPSSCLCEGPMIISGVSPVGGYCENDLNKACSSSSDCPGSVCNTSAPNGKEGNFLTIFGKNFNKASGNQQIFLENFESYSDQQVPNGPAFSDLQVGSSAKILIAKTPIQQSSSLFFKQFPGNVDGLNSKAEVVYSLTSGQNFVNGHLYGIQLTYQGASTNNLEIYFNNTKVSVISPGQYTNQRSLFVPLASLSASNSQKFKFVLVDGPTGNGTSLYIDDFSIVDITNNQRVTIGGVVARSAAETYPQCVNSANNQLVVVIPSGVQNGEIIISRNGEQDSTNDDKGPKVPNFLKNSIARPGLCSLTPNAAQTNDNLSFFGNNLKNSSVFFGNYQENIGGKKNLVDNNYGSSTVPSVYAGGNSLFVGNGKLKSNFLYFTKLNDLPPAPSITAISPDSGPAEQYVTISGSNFGNTRGNGKVFFGDKEAIYQFPEECSYSLWSDKEILVKVPENINLATSAVRVLTDSWDIDSSRSGLYFTFNPGQQLDPGICRIDPNRGPVSSKTTLFGENFGSNGALANVYFNSVLATSTISASRRVDKVEVTVPDGAVSGRVRLENSNLVNFQVGSCQKDDDCFLGVCCGENTAKKGQCARNLVDCLNDVSGSVFEWAFTTAFDNGFSTSTPPDITNSCLGKSREAGSCQTNESCPNVPGKCSSGSEIITVDKGACCPDGYEATDGLCLKAANLPWSDESQKDSFCKTLPEYNKRNRLVYSSDRSCIDGWIKINNGLCAKGRSIGELSREDNCALCASGEEFIDGKCAIRIQCKGNEVCNSLGRCTIDEAPSCECCCQIGNGNQDCCAPLICSGTCGGDNQNDNSGLGKCSGCYAAGNDTASRDAACNCSGHNGQFCAVSSSFPSGACVDCSTLDETGCKEHSDVCCLDAKNKVNGKAVCRGGQGDLVNGEDGYCAYYDCSTTGDKKCASTTPTINGAYSTVASCEKACDSNTGNGSGLGLNCNNTGSADTAYTCDVSVCGGAFSNPFSCINSAGTKIDSNTPSANGECGVCCCTPGDNASCQAINAKLSCYPNKGDCSGASRGLCCGCTKDEECGGGNIGCGTDSCCYPKPSIKEVSPKAGANNICRNTGIEVIFDRPMDSVSINNDSVKLLEEHPIGYKCPSSTPLATESLKENVFVKTLNFVEKIIASIANIFRKDSALADNTADHAYCQIPVNIQISEVTKNYGTSTSLIINPKTVLAKNTKYLIFVKGNDNNAGVLSIDGVGLVIEKQNSLGNQEQSWLNELNNFEKELKDLDRQIREAEEERKPEEIIESNNKFDEVERKRNNDIVLEINSFLGQPKELKDEIVKLEEIKDKVAYYREQVYLKDKREYQDELLENKKERDRLAEKINTKIDELINLLQNSGNQEEGTKINGASYQAFTSSFTTKSDICQIDYTTITPDQYLFSTITNDTSDDTYGRAAFDSKDDRDKVFTANAYSSDNQLLNPVTGYSWTWEFKVADPSLVSASAPFVGNKIIATASDKVSDAKTLIYSTVKMPTNNQYFGGNGKKSSAELFIFVCANPWPRVKSDGTWAPWQDLANTNPFQYDFYYCRDAGDPGKEDDLPEIDEAKIPGQLDEKICSNDSMRKCQSSSDCEDNAACIPGVLKEYYFFRKN